MALSDSIRAFEAIALAAIANEASHFSPLDGSISLAASDSSRSDRLSAIHPSFRATLAVAYDARLARRHNRRRDVPPGSIQFGPFIPPAN
jgi:hypothetical protein